MTENEFKRYLALGLCATGVWGGQKEATMYSYNWVVLPKLPEWDKAKYPYASIHLDGSTGYYWLWLSTEPLSRGTLGFIQFPDGATGIGSVYYPNEHTSWPEFTMDEGDIFTTSALWANYNILNANGTVYLEASDPVPVYE